MKLLSYILLMASLLFSACQKSPLDGFKSHERAIEAVTLGGGLVQVGPADVNRDSQTVKIKVLVQQGTDFSNVIPTIRASYKATISPQSGMPVNFADHNNEATYTVTSESGETRQWTVTLVPFSEALLGTYSISDLSIYGGTGPQYGGGAVFNLSSKNVWPEDGPSAELDNKLTFTYTGVTSDGNTYGTVTNSAGQDGKYANFIFEQNPVTDVNHFYRKIPEGEAQWLHDYNNNTVVFTFPDESTSTATFDGPQTIYLGNGLNKTITDNAFTFSLNSMDDYDHIYSDYDKIVSRPYKLWVDVKKTD